jgi:hypothetical protein
MRNHFFNIHTDEQKESLADPTNQLDAAWKRKLGGEGIAAFSPTLGPPNFHAMLDGFRTQVHLAKLN